MKHYNVICLFALCAGLIFVDDVFASKSSPESAETKETLVNPLDYQDIVHGNTLLHEAARDGNVLKVKSLIAAGAKINIKNKEGKTPMSLASENKNIEVEAVLQSNLDLFRYAAPFILNDECVRGLIAALGAGACVNVKCDNGATPLHCSTRWRKRDGGITQLLLRAGALVGIQDDDGNTALHDAAFWGSEAAVRLLLAAGALVNIQDKDGYTSLHKAALSGCSAIVRLLLDAKADKKLETKEGKTALDIVRAREWRRAHIEILLESEQRERLTIISLLQ